MSIKDIENFYSIIFQNKYLRNELSVAIENCKQTGRFDSFITDKLVPLAKTYGISITEGDVINYLCKDLPDSVLDEISGGNLNPKILLSLAYITICTSLTPLINANNKSLPDSATSGYDNTPSNDYFSYTDIFKNFSGVLSNKKNLHIKEKEDNFEKLKSVQSSYESYNGKHQNNLSHRSQYLRLADIDKNSLTASELIAMDEYTKSSSEINFRLRNNIHYNDELDGKIREIKKAFKTHKLSGDITTYRGLTDRMISFLFRELNLDAEIKSKIYNEDGSINHKNLIESKLYLLMENMVFKDEAFVSTTTNEFFAVRWANELCHRARAQQYKQSGEEEKSNSEINSKNIFSNTTGSHLMVVNIPKGTEAMFVDTMYVETNFPRGQNELTVSSGHLYRIKKVEPIETGRYKFYVDVLR